MSAWLRSVRARPRPMWLALLLLCLLLSGVASLLVGKDVNWDLRNYHLYNPYAFVNDRITKDIAPAQRQSYHNPLADLPFYGLFLTINDQPAAFTVLMGLPYGLALFLLLLISRELLHPDSPQLQRLFLIAAMVLIGGTGAATRGVIGSTMNEIPMSLFQLIATFLVLFTINGADRRSLTRSLGLFFLAGFMSGIPAGLKLSYAIFSMAIGIGILALSLVRRVSVWGVVISAAGMFVGFAVVSYHWMFSLWQAFGNPLLPYFNDVFQSAWAPAQSFSDHRFLPQTLSQAAFYPFHWALGNSPIAGEVLFRDWRMATLWLAAAFLFLAQLASWLAARSGRRWSAMTTLGATVRANDIACPSGHRAFQPGNLLFLAITFGGAYLLWLKGFGIYRYTVFLEFLSGPLIVAAAYRFTRPGAQRISILALLTVWLLATTEPQQWGRSALGDRFVDVQTPTVEPYSLVFLVGNDPQAYVIPFMEPTARYIGINNNYLRTGQDNYSMTLIRGLIAEHQGLIYALFGPRLDSAVPNLSDLGLRVSPINCDDIIDNAGNYTPSRLCLADSEPLHP